jgi:hypothetical protein
MIVGAAEGVLATAAMTVIFGIGKASGLLSTPPPEGVVDRAARQVGTRAPRPPVKGPLVWVAHFAFGAAMGGLFRAIRPRPRAPVREGLAFGLAVWAVSYFLLLPAGHLFPRADRDDPRRQAVNAIAHAVFGLTLGASARRA